MPAIDYLELNDKIMIEMGISMLFAFIWGWAATKIAVPISIRYNIIDMPEKRKLHSEATPRGGGIVLWSGLLLFILLCHGRTDVNLVLFAWCASAVFMVGYLDDMKSLSPILRLTLHLLASTIVLIPLYKNGNLPPWGWLVASIWIAAMISAYNMIDGMNGLALCIFAISSCIFLYTFKSIFWAFGIGITLGILPWNYPKAKTFLGDGGSTLLGFTHSCLLLYCLFESNALTKSFISFCVFLALAGGIPFLDMSFAVLRRIAKGISPFSPDKEHIHHRLVRRGLYPFMVLIFMVSFHAILITLSLKIF